MESSLGTQPHTNEQLDSIATAARRRLLVALLVDSPRGGLPTKISEKIADTDTQETVVDMRHTHLPKLEDYGFIRWDRETHHVTRGPQFGEIKPLLTILHDHADELPDDWL